MSVNTSVACRINIQDFEGPLDLLLFLIRRDELDITTINVSQIADQYLKYIREMEELNLDIAAEYLVMAATLTKMKSRMLLPVERAIMDETEDPMDTLMRHLVLYRAFKEVAADLRDNETIWRDVFSPPGERERYKEDILETETTQATLLDLLLAIENMSEAETLPAIHRVRKPLMSQVECLQSLDLLLPLDTKKSFTEIIGPGASQAKIVSFFVTLLELMRRGWLKVEQNYPFAEITLQRLEERWNIDA